MAAVDIKRRVQRLEMSSSFARDERVYVRVIGEAEREEAERKHAERKDSRQ